MLLCAAPENLEQSSRAVRPSQRGAPPGFFAEKAEAPGEQIPGGLPGGGRQGLRRARALAAESKKVPEQSTLCSGTGAVGGARTPDLLVRSQSLYPTELQPQDLVYFIAFG